MFHLVIIYKSFITPVNNSIFQPEAQTVKFCSNFRIQKGGKLLHLAQLLIGSKTNCGHIF